MKEIERKFLLKTFPNLDGIEPIRYERYFLNNDKDNQVRMQRKGNKFELEKKVKINDFEYEKEKIVITEKEFIKLSKKCDRVIIRDSYLISNNPNITIKKYYGDCDGLIRVEIEFESIEELNNFKLPNYFGSEITGTKLGNDSELVKLSREEFLKILNEQV